MIFSNTTSLPEIGGSEALYLEPKSPTELAARLRDVASWSIMDAWKNRVLERASRFSWRASLEGLFAVYGKLIHDNGEPNTR